MSSERSPTLYRLKLNIDTSNCGRHLQITDIVIGSSKDREESWEDWEKTTAILRINISTVGGIKVSSAPVATLSGHAIARWYQRTGCRDQAKLLRDIGMILDAAEPDRVVVPSGVWLGKTVNAFT